jgi:inorganic pyrophosphatase
MKLIVPAVIEMPTGSNYKYEVDKETGVLVLDRILSEYIPYSYGYIPDTLQKDGDPLDIFVISEEALVPLSRVSADMIGIIRCLDGGVQDDKVVAVLDGMDKSLYPNAVDAIMYYLKIYKQGFEVIRFDEAPWALQVYQTSRIWPTNPAD